MHWVILAAVAAAVVVEPTIPRDITAFRIGKAGHPVYEKDARVRVPVELKETSCKLTALFSEIRSRYGVIVNSQPGLRGKGVWFSRGEQRLDELMAQLAVLLSAEWYAVGDRYVLARDPRLVALSAVTFEESGRLMGEGGEGIGKSLSAEQWNRLEAGETLMYGDLSPAQKAHARGYAIGAVASSNSPEFALGGMERDIRLTITGARSRTALFSRFEGPYGQVGRGWIDLKDLGRR